MHPNTRSTARLVFALGVASFTAVGSQASASIAFTPSCFANHPSIAEVAADFNEDGVMDVVLSTTGLNPGGSPILGLDLEIYLGHGDGTFSPATTLNGANSAGIIGFTAADVNNDGHADLVTANGQGTVSVFTGHGDGTFDSMKNYGAAFQAVDVVAGDFNGDGKLDLAVGDGGKPRIAVLLGTGKGGSFKSRVQYDAGFTVRGLAIGDIDGDGKLDIVTLDNAANSIFGTTLSVFRGNGDGTFQPFYLLTAPQFLGRRIFMVDFDHDGKLDLVFGSQGFGSSGVMTMRGHGDGTFDPAVYTVTSTSFATTTLDVAVGDINGDGRTDVVAANVQYDSNLLPVARDIAVLLAQSDGSLVIDGHTSVHYARGLAVADFNGDGRNDVATDDCVQLQAGGPAPASMLAPSSPAGAAAPARIALAFSPNPWRAAGQPPGQLDVTLPHAGHVSLALYDLGGRRISTLIDGEWLEAGPHSIPIARRPDAAGAGVYFYRLWTERGSATARVVLTAR